MPNRLANETSPYLLQHAENPVDWYPWGPEALERARREDKPILLSVGYSACHWCHVMAHESFEDEAIAAVMNRHFVNVKVDREERPDIDQIYQTAHQLLSRATGGWPLTVFLAPDGTPFFSGTYFPKTARYGLPGFGELLERIAEVWRTRRGDIDEQNARLRALLARLSPSRAAHRSEFEDAPIRAALGALRAAYDTEWGGFGSAPKFPHPTELDLCLRHGAADMALGTLERMCRGGLYDQLGGGFARYSVDRYWRIPHFEKMLYDNGQLLALLADAWRVSGEPLFARCAERTAAWLLREMQSPEGGFYASLDADSEGEEGRFYVWDRGEVRALLSPEEYRVAARAWGLEGPPNFEGRHWHLYAAEKVDAADEPLLSEAREKLFAARERRVRPGRDEKVLASWNALAIAGLARAGRIFGRAEWIAAARRALDFIRTRMWCDGRLAASYKDGRAPLAAYLDDYAFLVEAVLELLQAQFRPEDLDFAEALADVLLEQFEDRDAGGFFFTAHAHERLLYRPKTGHDSALPSGNGAAALALARLAAITGEQRYARAAERTLEAFYPSMREQPAGFAKLLVALAELIEPPSVLVLRGRPGPLAEWSAELAREYLPDTLVLAIPEDATGLPPPLDKPARPEPVNGWLCRGVTCLPPIASLAELKHACRRSVSA